MFNLFVHPQEQLCCLEDILFTLVSIISSLVICLTLSPADSRKAVRFICKFISRYVDAAMGVGEGWGGGRGEGIESDRELQRKLLGFNFLKLCNKKSS